MFLGSAVTAALQGVKRIFLMEMQSSQFKKSTGLKINQFMNYFNKIVNLNYLIFNWKLKSGMKRQTKNWKTLYK